MLKQWIEYILSATKTGLDIIDSEYNIRYIDPKWEKVFGDPTGRKCYEYYMDRTEVCPDCGIVKALQTKAPYVTEQILVKEGNRPIQVTAIPFQNDEGEWLVAELKVDISERKRTEGIKHDSYDKDSIEEKLHAEIEEHLLEELLTSERRYRELVEHLREVIFKCEEGGKLSFLNRTWTEILGYSIKESLGCSIGDFIFEEDREAALSLIDKDHGNDTSGEHREVRFRRKDGSLVWLMLSGRTGEFEGKVGSLYDIDQRKRAEEETKKIEAQLLQAQKMEAIGTLAGGIAHDFNNILQAVLGYTQLLLMKKEIDDPDSRYLNQIDKSIQRADELIKRLLIFSRKVKSKLRPIDLNQAVLQIHKILRRTIPRMIDIQLNLSGDIKVINADSIQIEQIMMNLAVNAKDAMPYGGKLIFQTEDTVLDEQYCKTHFGAKPGKYVLLSVSDTGQGMDKEILEHIFEPFYSTKEIGRGTGLGLAMVYGIVKSHGGYITCISEPSQGTVFKIYFPVLEIEDLKQEAKDKKEVEIRGGHETILFVDDEETLRDQGQDVLAEYGYATLIAEDGEKAVEIFKKEKDRIDLVILDIGLPGMGGDRCLQELLNIDPKIKVIVASGYTTKEKMKEMLKLGAAEFFGKPYRLADMLNKVREVLDRE